MEKEQILQIFNEQERGLSIVFEGADGSGKTTQVEEIAKKIGAIIILNNEKDISKKRKEIEKKSINNPDKRFDFYKKYTKTEAEQAKNILLNEGKNVILDRSVQSTLANHRAMGSQKAKESNWSDITDFKPDLTFYLDVEKKERIKRLENRGNLTKADKKLIEEGGLLDKTLNEYEKFSNDHIKIDTTGKSIEDIQNEIFEHIKSKQQKIIFENSIENKNIINLIDDIEILKKFNLLGFEEDEEKRLNILKEINSNLNIKQIISKILYLLENDFKKIFPYIYVSGAGMIKIRLLENKYGRLHYHLFDKDKLNSEIVNNKHVHSFQAISNVLSGKIKEELYEFNEANNKEIENYNKLLKFVESLDDTKKDEVIYALNNGLKNEILNPFLKNNGIKYSDILGLNTVFDSEKIKDSDGKILHEKFYTLGVYDVKFIKNRVVKGGETYILKSENGHKVNILEKSSTLFISDVSYRSKGYNKKHSQLKRGHAKIFPFMQEKIEKRDFGIYYNESELKNILISEIKNLLNN